MFDFIVGILMVLFELISCKIFFESFGEGERENQWRENFISISIMLIGCVFLATTLYSHIVIRIIIIGVLIAIVMGKLFQITILKSLILAALFQGLVLSADYIAFTVNQFIFLDDSIIESNHSLQGTLIAVVGKILLFLGVIVVQHQFSSYEKNILSESEWIRFLFFPLFSIVLIITIITTFEGLQNQKQANVFMIMAIGMAGMNIFVYYLIQDIMGREKQLSEKRIFELEVKNQALLFRSIYEHYNTQKKKIHEFKNEITCIAYLIKQNQYQKAEHYLAQIAGHYEKEADMIDTNHVIVNAIINTKYQEALNKDIVLAVRVNDLSLLTIKEDDIVVVLSNLLNNAIEACEKCKKEKIIHLKLLLEQEVTIISVKNTIEEAIESVNGELLTTKNKDKEQHGVGVKNVIHLVEKYHGSHSIKISDHDFLFSIVLPNQGKE